VIETERLALERWDESHAAMLARLGATPSVVRYVGPGEVWSSQKSRQVHHRNIEHWRHYGFGWRAAVEKASGRQVGLIALNFLGEGTEGLDPGEYEIGWWLDPVDHGRGFAREGARALRDEARGRLGAPGLVARIQPPNGPSIAVAEAIGLTLHFRTIGSAGEAVAVYRGVLQNNSSFV
jgi:RimJ/RimL family protein N-acetyltransferase